MLNAEPLNPVWGHVSLGTDIRALWGGPGAILSVGEPVLSVRDPTDKKYFGRKKLKEVLKPLFFVAVSKKCVFVEKGAISLLFRPLVHPIGAACTEKTCAFSGPKWAKNAEKVDFPGLWGCSGRNTC